MFLHKSRHVTSSVEASLVSQINAQYHLELLSVGKWMNSVDQHLCKEGSVTMDTVTN